MNDNEKLDRRLAAMAKKWPSTVVTRQKIEEFTGGMLNRGTMARLDTAGKGPPGKFYIGRKAAYPVDEIIALLKKRCSTKFDGRRRVL